MTDEPELENEAESIVETFNDAKESYAPGIAWMGMCSNHGQEGQSFVFEATEYVDPDGLVALQDMGYSLDYVEGYPTGGGGVQIIFHVPVSDDQ